MKAKKVQKEIYKLMEHIFELVHFNVVRKKDAQILSLTLLFLRRMEGLFSDYKDIDKDILEFSRKHMSESPYIFYNTSDYSLKSLYINPDDLYEKIIKYLDGYDNKISEAIYDLGFIYSIKEIIKKEDYFLKILKMINEIDLSLEALSNYEMDYILVDIYNIYADVDQKDIPIDVLDLTSRLTFTEDNKSQSETMIISDYALGIGSLLINSISYIKKVNKNKVEVLPIGVETNSYKFSIAKLRFILFGYPTSYIENNDFLFNLQSIEKSTTHSIMLDPQEYSRNIEKYKQILKEELDKETEGYRFKAGLPMGENGFYLYIQHIYDVLRRSNNDAKKATIISTKYPLLTKRGPQNKSVVKIREWMLKEDFIETIIALPIELSHNSITPYYIWIINKNKNKPRLGQIQFIDATDMGQVIRREGKGKYKVLSETDINDLVNTYISSSNDSTSKFISISNISPDADWTNLFKFNEYK